MGRIIIGGSSGSTGWSKAMKDRFLIVEELRSQSDRGVAIVGGAMVDDALTKILRAVINSRPSDDKDAKEDMDFLFTNDGPMLSTKTRSCLAYLFGIIGPKTRNDLKYIAKIRNRFAHWVVDLDAKRVLKPLTFKDNQITGWANSLDLPKRGTEHVRSWKNDDDENESRAKFSFTVAAIWFELDIGIGNISAFKRDLILP